MNYLWVLNAEYDYEPGTLIGVYTYEAMAREQGELAAIEGMGQEIVLYKIPANQPHGEYHSNTHGESIPAPEQNV